MSYMFLAPRGEVVECSRAVQSPWDLHDAGAALYWAAGFVVALILTHVLRRVVERFRRRWRARRALGAERSAQRLLERSGYTVRARQVTRTWPVRVGDQHVEVALRADYLVARGEDLFIAEVKAGAHVARIRHGPTRRQLLEYQLAYAVRGVLLVDVERGRVEKVSFPALG